MHDRHWAQDSPFDTGFHAIRTLFTGTIAKVASRVAVVIGGYGFAHVETGAKKAPDGVAAGTGIVVLAVNVLSWRWGRIASPPYVDVGAKNVILDDLRQSPYSARIEFEKVYSNPADHTELERERWMATVTYVFRENVKNNELPVNPLGLTIVRFRADQAFS